MQSRALLFLAWLPAFLAREDGGNQNTALDSSCGVNDSWRISAQSVAGVALVQRKTGRGIGMIEAEDFSVEAPGTTNSPSFGLLFIQSVLLLALLGVVLLVTNLVLRDRAQQESSKDPAAHLREKDPAWAQTQTRLRAQQDVDDYQNFVQTQVPRANDGFSIQTRSASYAPPRPGLPYSRLDPPVVSTPLNRSLSLPAQPGYPSYGSPSIANRVPKLDLPPPRVSPRMGAQSVPVGLNLESCAAWATLGTHSTVESEEGTWSNSRPSTLPLHQSPRPPATGPIGSPLQTVPAGVALLSDYMGDVPCPIQYSPPVAPDSQSDLGLGSGPVVLQWYPQQHSVASMGWNNATPARTRSLSPVPSSHSGRAITQSQAPPVPGPTTATPSFTPPPDGAVEGPQVEPRQSLPTLRPSSNFQGMPKTASQAGFTKDVDGIVQWFNLATPRPGFVPSDLAPLGPQVHPRTVPGPVRPSKPSNINRAQTLNPMR